MCLLSCHAWPIHLLSHERESRNDDPLIGVHHHLNSRDRPRGQWDSVLSRYGGRRPAISAMEGSLLAIGLSG